MDIVNCSFVNYTLEVYLFDLIHYIDTWPLGKKSKVFLSQPTYKNQNKTFKSNLNHGVVKLKHGVVQLLWTNK